MSDSTKIKTTKTIYPQIYAYDLPNIPTKVGWIKIGYTERKDVDKRIKEQTHTAAINLEYDKLWSGPAKFVDSDEWFRDTHLHSYLQKFKNIQRESKTEWFFYNSERFQAHKDSLKDFDDFRNKRWDKSDQWNKQSEYTLRREQAEAVEITLAYAKSHQGGEFLWNAKPRFGKTLSAYDLASKMGAKKVLIVTNRPAIANSWYDDFETFIAWQTNYLFVSTSDSLKDRAVFTWEEYVRQNSSKPEEEWYDLITFISLQDLKGAIPFGGRFDKLEWVKSLQWDLLVIDEAHEGVDTFKTDIAFDNINRSFTLHLSGTPFKAVARGKFSDEQIFNWTYADEQDAKAQWSNAEQNNPYEQLPRLNLFSYQMSQMITDEVNKGAEIDGEGIDFAFDLNEFFETDNSGKFVHEAEVKKWLDTLSKNEKFPFSTDELRAELKHTFWLLDRVASAKALKKLLEVHPVFENYETVLAAGDGKTDEDTVVNEKSLERVCTAIKENKRTITISVGQLTTGVTIPEWSAVLMLSNMKSASEYMQAAFRAQNPWEYEADGNKHQKQNAYVFDFAPERTLIIYDKFANDLKSKTACGGGTSDERETNIKTLLNFFPVIAEDSEGKMVELDARQVLTIPTAIKAREVVRRGFMSNFLFQNISGIFASPEVKEILEQLKPVDVGKVTPRQTSGPIDTQGVKIDGDGKATAPTSLVIAETEARFGPKVYADIADAVRGAADQSTTDLTDAVATAFTDNVLDRIKGLAKDNKVTVAQAEQVVKQNANIIAREVEIVQKQAEIKQAEAEVEYKRQVAAAQNNDEAVAEANENYKYIKQKIQEDLKKERDLTIEEKTKELVPKCTEAILEKVEDKKKTIVEDVVRARLRGFACTIPSFLMAYGTPATTLANFDANIKDEVFKEVTGITISQFRTLRDEHKFFDPVVFDKSVQEFLHKKEQLADYFDDSQTEDIFDYIPPQKTNQIFTPKNVVKLMIDKLEEENPNIFTNKDLTFADLYVKSGLYLTEIVKRLYSGLEAQIPDEKQRIKHILENQIFGFAPSEIIYNIAKNYVFGAYADINNSHLECRDLTEIAKNGGDAKMKFDVVVGNPPYQESGDARDEPIYHYFYDLAERVSQKYCLISPARFLFNAGQTPKSWNEKMLNDTHLRVEYYEQNSANVFANTVIKGGIAVVYRDIEQIFGNVGVFTHYDELNFIASKVADMDDGSFSTIVQPQGIYRFSKQFFADFPQAEDMQGKGTKSKIVSKSFSQMDFAFHNEKTASDDVCMLGLDNSKREYKWISSKYLVLPESFEKYRVIIAETNNTGVLGEALSNPLIGVPFIAHTDTFLTIGAFDTEAEANAVMKYIKSKFARVLLGVLKVTQHTSRSTWAKVPLQDFTQKSDIDWTKPIPEIDKQLYAKYGLDKNEITFIEEKITAME
ncbi:MAG: Eco57I restriction-modification methylase domain-containing protein [Holophagales bacterium]|jgi:superfamily II DNA or RNA helicase|nr:Eco57I restriction-modification methylase domain-containing protein [Holophagales bacterium]